VVRGYYQDDTDRIEELPDGAITGYDPEKSGSQTLLVTLNGKTATFNVTVGEKRVISVTIGLPNTAGQQPKLFGIPADGIILSTSKNKDLPNKIVISAAGIDDEVYSAVEWFVDGTSFNESDNIIVIEASKYALKIPHRITFTGIKDGVEYAQTITFTVER
jgi:hypothetical protein